MGANMFPVINGWEAELAPPTPLQKETNFPSDYGRDLPTGDDDGSWIRLPPTYNTGGLERYNAAGAQVWSKVFTDIHADADHFTGVFWLDTSDSAIWVWVCDIGTTPDTYYLAKVALSDGAVTSVGSCQPGDGLFGTSFYMYYTERAAMGSGNLTIRDGDYKIVLDTSDGSIATAAVQVTQNGAAIHSYNSYETEDGLIYLVKAPIVVLANGSLALGISRGGTMKNVRLPFSCPCGLLLPYFILWGGYVALCNVSTNQNFNSRFFERTALDAWITKIADYYGLPN